MTAGSHPARSPEFLSRLHDGDLSPAERAHFESHRAHCAECRGAAAEFEAALALYRSSRPNPPSPDLAARILRKLQSSGNRRPFFGPTFGIDLRWAGAFAAAVIATIIGSAIVAKNEAAERMSREPIRVSVSQERKPAAPELSLPVTAPRPAAAQGGALAAPPAEGPRAASARPADARRQRRQEGKLAEAAPEMAKKDEVGAIDSLREKRKSVEADAAASAPSRLVLKNAAPPAAPAASVRSESSLETPSVGVAAPKAASRSDGRPEARAASARFAERAVRLVILEADGAGSPPDLLHPREADIPATLRGRTFLLVVDATGHVREAVPSGTGLRGDAPADARKEETPSLLSLQFAPGDRQRRLWLRVE
ncbi:MAG: zf-HC2 domain-containing protein [Acidobacteriota bacterium]